MCQIRNGEVELAWFWYMSCKGNTTRDKNKNLLYLKFSVLLANASMPLWVNLNIYFCLLTFDAKEMLIYASSREMSIWKSCSEAYLRPEVYLELSRTSTLEFFAKIFSHWKTLIIFAEKLYRSCSTRFYICLPGPF